MPKRKRDDEIEDQISRIDDQALRIRVSRLKARFEHGVSQLTAQLRLARGFDRQKMTRRVKQAGTDAVKIDRLNAEIQVLKDIKEAKVARNHLLKQCVRTKRIGESEAFVTLFGTEPKFAKGVNGGVAEANVLGRLFKVEAVSRVLPEIMKGIREVVGADGLARKDESDSVPTTTNGGDFRLGNKAADEDDFTGFSDESDETANPSTNRSHPSTSNDDVLTNNDDDEDEDEDEDEENLTTAYSSRLAALCDEDSNSDSDNDFIPSLNGQNLERLDAMEITDDEDDEEDSPVSPKQSNSQPPTKNLEPVKPATKSTSFLPSLMHSGYYSGSDTSAPDSFDPDGDTSLHNNTTRKNRRGQKARQAIAEKKYGTKAKHLLKSRGTEAVHGDRQRLIQSSRPSQRGRDEGWDARKGAVATSTIEATRGAKSGNSRSAKAPNRFERRNGYTKPNPRDAATGIQRPRFGSGANHPRSELSSSSLRDKNSNVQKVSKESAGRKPGSSGEKLHPSWEAARKKKLESAAVGAASFVGKKITFD